MRSLFSLLILFSFLSSKAQTYLPVGINYYTPWSPITGYHPFPDSIRVNQRWYFSKYAGISAGSAFFNGGSETFVSAPFVLQLNHPLNNNLVAFAGISAAPVFFNFSHSFTDPAFYRSYPGSNPSNAYGFGMNSRVELGLMYINDAKTFSLSGSIGVERSSYPYFPAEPINRKKQ